MTSPAIQHTLDEIDRRMAILDAKQARERRQGPHGAVKRWARTFLKHEDEFIEYDSCVAYSARFGDYERAIGIAEGNLWAALNMRKRGEEFASRAAILATRYRRRFARTSRAISQPIAAE